jgi:hypothetical protein
MGLLDRFQRTDRAAEGQYMALLNQAVDGQTAVLPELAALGASGSISEKHRRQMNSGALFRLADRYLADELLTEDEEDTFLEIAEALGFTQEEFATGLPGLMNRLALGRANDGRLPVLPNPQLMTQKDEVVHGELPAALLKEVTVREFRGGGSGVSFRIAKGVRFHTGQARGRSVVVGTEVQTADEGILSITNTRVVFLGSRKTIESKYSKLVNVKVYSDAITLGVSNRQNPSTFRVADGPFTAAIINAAAQAAL